MSAKRYSWYLPYMKSPTSEDSKTSTKMDNEQATFWLSQFIGKNLRIHASDGRVFGGQMKCTDRVCLTILSSQQWTDSFRTATSSFHLHMNTVHRPLKPFARLLRSLGIHLRV
jgi:hypothetical protein